jgi:hypothetical protein
MTGSAQFKFSNALLRVLSFFFASSLATFTFAYTPIHVHEKIEEVDESIEELLIKKNIEVSGWLDAIAKEIDLFLVGRKVTNKKNETSVKIENSSFQTTSDSLKNTTNLNVNLRLPNTEAYWMLKFATYDENESRRGIQNGYLRKTPRPQSNGAILGVFQKLGDTHVSFQPRVDLGNPVRISHSLKFDRTADFQSFNVMPRLEFYATPEIGTGVFLSANVNFPLTKNVTFTLIHNGDYVGRKSTFGVTNGFNFAHRTSSRTAIDYSFILASLSQPNYHLDGYTFAVSWSHILYRRILDYRVTPHIDFYTAKGFQGIPGFIFAVGLNF